MKGDIRADMIAVINQAGGDRRYSRGLVAGAIADLVTTRYPKVERARVLWFANGALRRETATAAGIAEAIVAEFGLDEEKQ